MNKAGAHGFDTGKKGAITPKRKGLFHSYSDINDIEIHHT